MEFKVNGVKQNYSMKLGEGGEAFFVFETTDEIPASLQTSPLVSPTASPKMRSEENLPSSLQEPEYLDLDRSSGIHAQDAKSESNIPLMSRATRASSDLGMAGSAVIARPYTHFLRCTYTIITISGDLGTGPLSSRFIQR